MPLADLGELAERTLVATLDFVLGEAPRLPREAAMALFSARRSCAVPA